MSGPNNRRKKTLAYEALMTRGLKELSCGCVIHIRRWRIEHARVCPAARRIYVSIGAELQFSASFKLDSASCPEMYHHWAKGILT